MDTVDTMIVEDAAEYAMIEVSAALGEVLSAASPLPPTPFPLEECCGLYAAETLKSPGTS